VHSLIEETRKEMLAKNEKTDFKIKAAQQEQPEQKKSPRFFMLFQIMPSALLLVCTLFVIFVGMRLLTMLEQKTVQQTSLADKWSEVGFEHLLQMNKSVQQGIDLIQEQREENQALRDEIAELTTLLNKDQLTQHGVNRTKEKRNLYSENEGHK
jgi:cell shape-determining protein MreC